MKLFDDYKPKIKQRKATITLSWSNYNESVEGKGGKQFVSVSFEGFQEGSSSPCDTEEEAQECVEALKKQHEEAYKIQVLDLRTKESIWTPLLNEWKEFIVNLCKEKGKEVEIWFDTSVPYDCEIALRLKEHNCYYYCVNFRFEKGKLSAYDSNFDGGTSFVEGKETKEEEEKEVIRVMEKVFNGECEDKYDKSCGQRKHNIQENGWIRNE